MKEVPILVCFAVKQEAGALRRPGNEDKWMTVLTGMGRKNAEQSIRSTLGAVRPGLVISAGFAGGLNPALKWRTVVFEEDKETGLAPKLLKNRAVPARFYCSDRVVVTAAEKAALWKSTGADAVEMESSVIRAVCREKNIPSATVRVISDAADADLPLDFNNYMTPDQRMSYPKLLWHLIRSPGDISKLILFGKNTSFAADELTFALLEILMPEN